MSKEEVIIRIEESELDPNFLRSLLNIEGCGSVVSFVGLTRGDDNGIKVKRLEFDAWENKLNHILSDIAKTSIDKFSVKSVLVAHRIGIVEPSEPIVCIHVGSKHRAAGFEACSWLINQLKLQAPLWKKEVRSDGEIWKQGLG
ncbi:MAG: molybdenum cofactor biosynthesis protein MoaE [Candidatus Thalassarchaeaceae archaeon]|jgi:molybdopterin synthase catalytic subunit|nr:molybdenum cofactor biosynthesis protein MoaE [Candidatus Thalassarchaeaceae archaeon]|tara:strand:- start:164 stop:592 length:429 start_codon:yes stop_codon:yes gene_type:complete